MVFDKQGSNYRINLKSFQILYLNIVLIQMSYQQLLKHLSQSLLNRKTPLPQLFHRIISFAIPIPSQKVNRKHWALICIIMLVVHPNCKRCAVFSVC